MEVRWDDDWSLGMSHKDFFGEAYPTEPETCEVCSVWTDDGITCLASLGCIDDATDDYRREVELELKIEARVEIEKSFAKGVGF